MSTSKRNPTGIRPRHSRSCATTAGNRCNCRPAWEANVYSRRDAKQIRKCFPTLAAAKAWRADATSALSRGKLRAPSPVTLRQAADEWLAGAKAGTVRNGKGSTYKPSTLRGYERALGKRVLPEFGHMRLSELRRIDVQDFADRLLAEGHDPSTILNTLDPLRAIFRRAIQREQVAVSPCANLDLPKPQGKRDRIASPDEARTLLDALPDGDRALWATAFYAGLRRGELRGLRWSDIDLPGRELHVRRSWDDDEGAIDGKSEAADRTVPIVAALAPELAAHKLQAGGGELAFAVECRPFIPSTIRRRALAAWGWKDMPNADRSGPRRVLVKAHPDALEPIGLHEARHTFASILIAAGVNAKAITEAMGHASVTMTFDTYGHLMPDGRDEARSRVDAYLGRAGGDIGPR